MGIFYIDISVMNLRDHKRVAGVSSLLVDTDSEHTWIRSAVLQSIGVEVRKRAVRFQMAIGQSIERDIGNAILRNGEFETVDEVVFALPTDMQLLGARTLECMNVRPDPVLKKLVAAGPVIAANSL